ncbi:hypothetical protein O3G_MSEX014586 [Manduca sexta]|uniref:Proton-coupled folate transporter n=1 Tax=Manduca sexta TaxID=7130 RepID=A0A921ZUT6_MANSE|nr:hypothetical protein O3G_MSEX014586 [Manduca sexta]
MTIKKMVWNLQIPKKISDTANVKSEVKEEPPVSWSERIKKLANWFTVEPCLILYFLALIVGNIAIEQLNQEKACRSYLNYNETICTDIIKNLKNDNRTNELRTEIIIAVNDIKAWQYPMQKGIPGILVPFIGAWSDRTGNRKVLIMMPVIGEIISNCGLFFTTYYFVEWPLWLTALIESLPTALSGGFSILLLGVFSYIADVTTAEARTFRMGMLAIIVPLCSIFGQSINGILLNAVGYYGVFTIILALHSFALIYIYIRIYDIRNEATEGTFIAKLISFFNPYNIWDTISLVIVIPLQQRIRVILLLCAFVFITGPIEAKGLLVYGYQTHRYLMSAVEISMFNTYATLLGIAGKSIILIIFYSNFTKNISRRWQLDSDKYYTTRLSHIGIFSGGQFYSSTLFIGKKLCLRNILKASKSIFTRRLTESLVYYLVFKFHLAFMNQKYLTLS